MLCLLFGAFGAMLLVAQDRQPPASVQPIAIRAPRLITGRDTAGQNESPIIDAVIIVGGEKITAVGSRLVLPNGATLVDLGEATLLPGSIDAHTHLLPQVGTLEAGKRADIVAVPGNALKDVSSLKHAKFVMKGVAVIRNDIGNDK